MSLARWNFCALFGASAVMLNTQSSAAVDLGCGFLECNAGCLVFRADSGPTYQFTVPPTLWRGAHRVRITGTVNPNCTPLCSGSTGCIQGPVITPCYATDSSFEITAEFKEGEFVNLNPSTDQLQINTWTQTKTADPPVLPYLWVALSGRGTITRIAAVDHYSPVDAQCVGVGEVLGEYRTAPDGCEGVFANPSRTTVDFDGNVWVANRNDIEGDAQEPRNRYGHVVKIGSGLAYQWKDRDLPAWQGFDYNNNGVLDTSTRLGEVFPWPNPDGDCDNFEASEARDELIQVYRVFAANVDGDPYWDPMGTRTIAVDRENHVWVGGFNNRWHERIDGQTGATLTPGAQRACGGYGGLVDCNGVLWSARGSGSENSLLRFDPATQASQCISVYQSYGLAANLLGDIWNTKHIDNRSSKLSSAGQVVLTTASTAPNAIWYRGVVVTPDDNDAWTAATGRDDYHVPPYAVTRHADNGTLRKIIQLDPSGGWEPTGVSVDSRGFVWVTNKASDNVMRINPNGGADALGAVDIVTPLGAGAFPYNYSDMTGVNLYQTIAPAGVWTIVRDGGTAGVEWQSIAWTEVFGTGTVTVQARSANNAYDLGKQLYVDLGNGECLDASLVGRYVQVRVQLNAYCHDPDMPVLQDLFIWDACPPGTIVVAVPPDSTRDARQPHPPNDNSLGARQGIGSPNSYTGGPEPIVVTLESAGKPVRGAACLECWDLCETGIEQVEGIPPLSANRITSVTEQTPGVYRIFLERPISAGHWTTISYLGGSSYVSYASLPVDVDRNGWALWYDTGLLSGILDAGCPSPYSIYQWDMNHNGICEPGYPGATDYNRAFELMTGLDTFIPWIGKHLPTNTCPGSSAGFTGSGSGEQEGPSWVEDFVVFITTLEVPEGDNADDWFVFVDTVLQATLWLLTDEEGKELAAALEVPDLEFASKMVHDFIPEIIAEICK
jgi:hypothetical protein